MFPKPTRTIFAALFVAVLLPGAARGDVTVAVNDIFTNVDGIATYVESVTYGTPVVIDVPGVGEAYEVHGTVSGVGWGGAGIVSRAALAHYQYEIHWLARWPVKGNGKTMVHFHHGGLLGGVVLAQLDRLLGANNPQRFAQRSADDSVSIATLALGGTYIAAARFGLLPDGRFAAKFLTSEVAPLTQLEVDQVRAAIAPGSASYAHPDLVAGEPVPAMIPLDTATFRDVDRALQRVVANVSGIRFRERISVSTSAGAMALGGMAFGRTAVGPASLRTGGNCWIPYDASSPLIYDGFIFFGFVYDSDTPRADSEQPFTAPAFFLQGRAEERYQQPIRMADELLEKGVDLDGSVWLYEIANMPHVPRDFTRAVPVPARNGEAVQGYVGAAIRNMHELLSDGTPPPKSRIAGRLDAGALVFDVVGGTTTAMPVREDPALDGSLFVPPVTVRFVNAADSERWQRVTAALDHEGAPIIGPSIACRIGGYQNQSFGTLLTPFSSAVLAELYGSFKGYRASVAEILAGLEAERLYDPKTESAAEIAERARSLFDD